MSSSFDSSEAAANRFRPNLLNFTIDGAIQAVTSSEEANPEEKPSFKPIVDVFKNGNIPPEHRERVEKMLAAVDEARSPLDSSVTFADDLRNLVGDGIKSPVYKFTQDHYTDLALNDEPGLRRPPAYFDTKGSRNSQQEENMVKPSLDFDTLA